MSTMLPLLTCVLQEYADEARLKQLVTKYSEFINFPIYLQVMTIRL
jgi:HSP90 family molecular chaperone